MLDSQHFGVPQRAVAESTLSDILVDSALPKYSLSPKAAAGILRRADRRGRKLPGHLAEALAWVVGQSILTEAEHSYPNGQTPSGPNSKNKATPRTGTAALIPERAHTAATKDRCDPTVDTLLIPIRSKTFVGGANDKSDESRETYIVNARQDPIEGSVSLDTSGYSHAIAIRTRTDRIPRLGVSESTERPTPSTPQETGRPSSPQPYMGQPTEQAKETGILSSTLGASMPAAKQMAAAAGFWSVRRLTPMECERLQGFPDGWTLLTDPGMPPSETP